MIEHCKRIFRQLSKGVFIDEDFKNSEEFGRKYILISLQRGRLLKWITFFVCFFSLYLDLILNRDGTIDILYRKTLVSAHVAALVLSLIYIAAYSMLKRSERYRFSRLSKAVILSDMFLSLLIGAVLSFNSQRYTGNIDAYMMVVLAVALVIPMYPKWVLGIYGFVHISFIAALSLCYENTDVVIKQFNSTTMVLIALVLFSVLYKYHINHFISEERLREDKEAFLKLFEINPFPLMISNFQDGSIRHANRKAMLFYDMQQERLAALNHKDLYENAAEIPVIYDLLKANGTLDNYVVEQKTLSGKVRRPIVNYRLIDYFGEKSILIGVADIAEIKRMERELSINASVDSLTGVFNRRVGMDLIRNRYEAARREGGGFNLCFIDIDNLKMVNDQYGHLEGDSFIVDVCRIIKEELNPDDLILRYGGDEFMILFSDDDEQEIDRAYHRLAARFRAVNGSGYKPYPINASIGMFSYKPEMDLDLEQIIEIVDKKMYTNKLAGKVKGERSFTDDVESKGRAFQARPGERGPLSKRQSKF